MNNRIYLFLVTTLFLMGAQAQWTPVLSQAFSSPIAADLLPFTNGVTYTFTINDPLASVAVYPASVALASDLAGSYFSAAQITGLTFTPTETVNLAFVPITLEDSVTLTIADSAMNPNRIITKSRPNPNKLTASFNASENQSFRMFIKTPAIDALTYEVVVCSEPATIDFADFPCINITSTLLTSFDFSITQYEGIISPNATGRYYVSIFISTDDIPVYLTVELSNCYNRILDAGEQCDFGADNQMCSDCTAAPGYVCNGIIGGDTTCRGICGNSIKTYPEECDNGNKTGCINCTITPGYTCTTNYIGSSICNITPGCGNGVVEETEQCDNFNKVGCTNCSIIAGFSCAGSPSVCNNCGNKIVEGTEQCDGTPDCTATCRFTACNNGLREIGQNCDNGGTNGDGCSNTCFVEPEYICTGQLNQKSNCSLLYVCGNAKFEPFNNIFEACDNGNKPGCSANCKIDNGWTCQSTIGQSSVCVGRNFGLCGDGNFDLGESCDDGNLRNGDGCDSKCLIQKDWQCPIFYLCFLKTGQQCGNNYYQSSLNEACDDGNNLSGDGCSADCKVEVGFTCYIDTYFLRSICVTNCGNGKYEPLQGEACDDFNKLNGDGCNSACKVESNFYCPFNVIGQRSACEPLLYGNFCGNGYVEGNEQCDDGFFILHTGPDNIDGCDKNCKIQFGWNCVSSDANNFRGISWCYKLVG